MHSGLAGKKTNPQKTNRKQQKVSLRTGENDHIPPDILIWLNTSCFMTYRHKTPHPNIKPNITDEKKSCQDVAGEKPLGFVIVKCRQKHLPRLMLSSMFWVSHNALRCWLFCSAPFLSLLGTFPFLPFSRTSLPLLIISRNTLLLSFGTWMRKCRPTFFFSIVTVGAQSSSLNAV